MEMLKKYFPYAFKEKADIAALVINIIIHIVVGAVVGIVIGLFSFIPVLGKLLGALGSLIDLYIFISLVLSILDYCKVFK